MNRKGMATEDSIDVSDIPVWSMIDAEEGEDEEIDDRSGCRRQAKPKHFGGAYHLPERLTVSVMESGKVISKAHMELDDGVCEWCRLPIVITIQHAPHRL